MRAYKAKRKAFQTVEQAEHDRRLDTEGQRRRRAAETEEQRAERLARKRDWGREWYAGMSDDERAAFLEKSASAKRRRRAELSEDEREKRLAVRRRESRAARAARTPEEREEQNRAERERLRRVREKMTPEEKRAYRARRAKEARDAREKDVQVRIKDTLRSRLRAALSGEHKAGSAVRDLGCSIRDLKRHLEGQFADGMSWGNYGDGWHIDHVVPLCSFDLTDRASVKLACHYTNLQPLWKEDNLAKSAEDLKLKGLFA